MFIRTLLSTLHLIFCRIFLNSQVIVKSIIGPDDHFLEVLLSINWLSISTELCPEYLKSHNMYVDQLGNWTKFSHMPDNAYVLKTHGSFSPSRLFSDQWCVWQPSITQDVLVPLLERVNRSLGQLRGQRSWPVTNHGLNDLGEVSTQAK